MSFPSELQAFDAYARAMPNNALLLVDTYNTIDGVKHAIEVGHRLRANGHELTGIRLDSGDLAQLSIEARTMRDAAGFPKAVIAASNELDEYSITRLKQQGAKINVWGVGTRLITAYDQPALGGVYKLSAIRSNGGAWEHKVKLSEQTVKISNPGVLNVRRFVDRDIIWDESSGEPATADDLLIPIYRKGLRVYDPPPLTAIAAPD